MHLKFTGEADVNYPTYSFIPKSSFSCIGRPVGFYADTELRCQVWHICDEDRRQQSFLCTNGTVYSQDKRVCDWWYNVNCDPTEVSKNYLQNYDLYKGPPPKSDNDQEQNNESGSSNDNRNSDKSSNDFDYQPTTKSYKDPFSQFPSSRQGAESQQKPRFDSRSEQQFSKPTPTYNEPIPNRDSSRGNNDFPTPRRNPPQQSRPTTTTSTTTYRPPTTYATPPPPAALQASSFPPRSPQHQRPQQPAQPPKNQPQQQQQSSTQSRTQPSIKTSNQNGKRIVEIRVPLSQIPPEVLAKYGKRIPENILKEIFLNFTRGQQKELQQEAIGNAKPHNPTGAGNSRSAPPKAQIPQNRQPSPPPPPPPSKKPVDFSGNSNPKPSFASSSKSNPPPPPPPPPPAEPQQKFRHSTPRKVDNVKFAAPTRELLAEYDDERQQVGESQNPIYSLQQLFSGHHSRASTRSKAPIANEVPREKESFNYEATSTSAPPQQYQEQFARTSSRSRAPPSNEISRVRESFNYEATSTPLPPLPYQEQFTRAQPRRRTQAPTTTARTTTTDEPQLITDRYFPVATKEEKKNAEIKRIFLVAKQGIKVLPPIPVLAGEVEDVPTARRQPPPLPVTHRPKVLRTTAIPDFSRIPPPPKVSIPEDYYEKNERFEEAESRYPRPSAPPAYVEPQFQTREYTRPTTTNAPRTTTTTTTTLPPPPVYREPDFTRRPKPNKVPQHKKPLPPPEDKNDDDSGSTDYDDPQQDRVNKEELELLRLAQEYIELTGQGFGARKTPKSA